MTPKILIVGAHPDDAEFHAGGLMCEFIEAGARVKILCLTDGSAGHHQIDRPTLATRRENEARSAAAVIDAEVEIWDIADGLLEASLTNRLRLIRSIRLYQPDVLVTHRAWDYHPDHRACGTLVQDACYMVSVPAIVPEVDVPPTEPIVLLMADHFTRPAPCRADVVLDVARHIPVVVDMLDAHASQVYEWLPHIMKLNVPADRKAWLTRFYQRRASHMAQRFDTGVEFAEVFELSEYGRQIDRSDLPGTIGLKALLS
jgi:LmbE family N-acetylglucosaminyl deacetylase